MVVLTGAGVSSASGIPTFRAAQTGLWESFRAEDLATPEAFERNPERVWQWYQWRRKLVRDAQPNAAHRALAALQVRLAGFQLITQNVDGLHQAAGSTDVIELHGNITRTICSRTRKAIELHDADSTFPPLSPHDPRGLARPDVVWFGEMLDQNTLERAFEAARRADVFLSVGTSALVEPAASLAHVAKAEGAYIIEINAEATPLSPHADMLLEGDAGRWLSSIAPH